MTTRDIDRTAPTKPDLPRQPARERRLSENTVRTLLERATQRCARIVERPSLAPPPAGLRAPSPGTVDRVDPTRISHIENAPCGPETPPDAPPTRS